MKRRWRVSFMLLFSFSMSLVHSAKMVHAFEGAGNSPLWGQSRWVQTNVSQKKAVDPQQEPFDHLFKVEATQASSGRVEELQNRAGVTIIGNWDELVTALANPLVDEIEISKPVTATKNASVSRSVRINGQNHLIDLNRYSITTTQGSDIDFRDVFFKGTTGNLVSGTVDKITFRGQLKSDFGNTAGIVSGSPVSQVVLDGVHLSYDREMSVQAAISAKSLVITNRSKVHSESMKFMTLTANSQNRIVIDGQSEVLTNTNKKTNREGQAWDLRQQVDFFVQGEGTKLEVNGNGTQKADYGGIFLIYAANSNLNVEDHAVLEVNSEFASAVLLQSKGGSFNVRNHAQIKLKQTSSQSYALGAALRFRNEGDMTFNIEKNSKIDIQSLGGGAPAIRMYGGNNHINISGNSEFNVYNKGNDRPANPGGDSRNQGILYTSGNGNSFNLKDEGSTVDIRAENGAAIDGSRNSIAIDAQENTYFIARGKTSSNTAAIFHGGKVDFQMNQVKYFDFRNDGGRIFDVGNTATFESYQSDLSVWKVGTDFDRNPFITWTLLDFTLSGSNYERIAQASSVDFRNRFGKMDNYGRMTANNQAAKIDEVRVPTDADRYIFAHGTVPEGRSDIDRDAYTDEVGIRVAVYEADGREAFQATARSVGKDEQNDGLSVYGDEARGGLFKLEVPEKKYLHEGQTVVVMAAWRGSGNEGSGESHGSPPEWLVQTPVKTQAVTPPQPAVIDSIEQIGPNTEKLKGHGEPGTTATLSFNDQLTSESTTVSSDGSFELILPIQKKKGDRIQVFLRDQKGLAQNVHKPPLTNNFQGNANPATSFIYHDREFLKGTDFVINGLLTLEEVPRLLDFGVQTITNKTSEYWAINQGDLVVSDTRGIARDAWRMTVRATVPLYNGAVELTDNLFYVRNGFEQKVTKNSTALVEEQTLQKDGSYVITEKWAAGKEGIKVVVPVNQQREGTYTGELLWSLENVPGNEGGNE